MKIIKDKLPNKTIEKTIVLWALHSYLSILAKSSD